MRPHHLRPRCLLPASPDDSAPYPGYQRAGVRHGCVDKKKNTKEYNLIPLFPGAKPVDITVLVKAMNEAERLSSGLC